MAVTDRGSVIAGPKGHKSSLAQCCPISCNGDVVYNKRCPHLAETQTADSMEWFPRAHGEGCLSSQIYKICPGKTGVKRAVYSDFSLVSLAGDIPTDPHLQPEGHSLENATLPPKCLTKEAVGL